jgi:energy-coupling factor transporter ATP-binding protein EcfA2/predicted nuclease with TOPRIM domain
MLDTLYKILDIINSEYGKNNIIFINGTFGSGKSYLLNELKKLIAENLENTIIYDYQHSRQIEYLHEFVYTLAMSCLSITNTDPNETFTLRNKFHNLLNHYQTNNSYIFKAIKQELKLLNIPEFFCKSNKDNKFVEILSSEEISSDEYEFLSSSFELTAKSFIIDILNQHIDLDNSQKKDFVFIIDNYDSAAGTINHWLFSYLLKAVDNCISELSANISNFSNLRVRDYINFSFIIASREHYKYQDANNFNQFHFKLSPLTKEQVLDFFFQKNIDIRDSIDFVYSYSKGNPFVLSLISEAVLLGDGEVSDYSQIESIVVQRAFNYLTEKQKDCLISVSFFDSFELETLEFLPLINNFIEDAFCFLSNTNEFCEKTSNNRIKVKDEIRTFIVNNIKNETPQTAKSLEIITELYYNYCSLFKNFEPSERRFLRMLSYFRCFDKFFAIQFVFGDDAPAVRKIIDKYPVFFEEKNGLYFVDNKISQIVLSLENFCNTELFETTNTKIREAWDKYHEQIQKELLSSSNELEMLTNNITDLYNKETEIKTQHTQLEANLFVINKEINEIEALLEKYKHDSNLIYILLPIFIIVLILINDIVKFLNIDFFFSMFIVILAGIVALNRIIVYFKIKKDQGSFEKINKMLQDLVSQKSNIQDKIDKLVENKQEIINNINTFNSLITKFNQDINILNFKISNKFYYD